MSTDHLYVLANDLMSSMKAAKEHNTREHQIRMDLRPLGLLIGDDPDSSFQVPLVSVCPNPEHDHAPHDQVDLMAMAIERYRPEHGKPHIVAMATEGYVTQKVEGQLERGDLRREFESNPESAVSEALVVYVAGHDAVGGFDMVGVMQPYAYGEMATVVWREQITYDTDSNEWNELMGRIPDVMAAAFAPLEGE